MGVLTRFGRRIQGTLSGSARAAAFLGLLALFAAVVVALASPQLGFSVRSLLGLGLILLVVYFVGAFDQVKETLLGKRGRYGTSTSILTIAFLGMLLLTNYVASRNHQRFDVTASGQFTLSPQTAKILQELDSPVHAIALFRPTDSGRDAAQNLLTEYGYRSNKFTYEFIDPDKEPAAAHQHGFLDYGDIFFESEGRRQRVTDISEQRFTSALLIATGRQLKRVYFLQGHGEPDVFDTGEVGYSEARNILEGLNFEADTLNLATTPAVPADAYVVVVASPKTALQPQELAALNQYLEKGGKAFFLLDPQLQPDLEAMLLRWGVAVQDGVVVDPTSYVRPDTRVPLVEQGSYAPAPMTTNLGNTFFPKSAALTVTTDKLPDYVSVMPFIATSADSWLSRSPGGDDVNFVANRDLRGRQTLGYAVQAFAPLPRPGETATPNPQNKPALLVVLGDSDFATNRYINNWGNGDLFQNTVNWLAEQEDLISIRPKQADVRRLVLNQRRFSWIAASSMGILPAAVLIVGGIAWWRRR